MGKKNLPEIFNGYSTKDLLETWEEIKSKEGTKSSRDQIEAKVGEHSQKTIFPFGLLEQLKRDDLSYFIEK